MATKQKYRQGKHPPTLKDRLLALSRTTWIMSITGVVIVGFLTIALIANNHGASTTTGSGSTCGVTTALGTLNTNKQALAVGATAPAINGLVTPDCTPYTLDQFKGKVVVLELFATWCPHCQAETAVLNQVQTNDASKGVQVLSVLSSTAGHNYESGDTTPTSMSDLRWFVNTFQLTYPALYDPAMTTANAYGLSGGYPTYYVINKAGIVTYVGSGETSYEQLESQVQKALAS